MVCSLGSGRMEVMARLLAAGSFSQTIEEEVGHWKLAAHRELHEADEANLLDEEDMHVFGLKPMVDSLHLVCCNACKKPVKASQYAAHAELCRSLKVTEESILELDGGTGHKIPPRKERKKLLTSYANQATAIGEQERLEPIDGDDTAASELQLDGKITMTSSFPMEAKRNPAYVDALSMMDCSRASPGNTVNSACVMLPPTKRSKFNCCDVIKSDVPLPLASKIYYSQRSNRLRSSLSHLYDVSTKEYCSPLVGTKEHCGDLVGIKMLHENTIPLKDSSPKESSVEQMDRLLNEKRDTHSLPSMQRPRHILAQSSEVCLSKSRGCVPTVNLNQSPVDDLRPQTAPVGLMRRKHLSKPYSFTGNSGTPLGTMQQPNGSVPVV